MALLALFTLRCPPGGACAPQAPVEPAPTACATIPGDALPTAAGAAAEPLPVAAPTGDLPPRPNPDRQPTVAEANAIAARELSRDLALARKRVLATSPEAQSAQARIRELGIELTRRHGALPEAVETASEQAALTEKIQALVARRGAPLDGAPPDSVAIDAEIQALIRRQAVLSEAEAVARASAAASDPECRRLEQEIRAERDRLAQLVMSDPIVRSLEARRAELDAPARAEALKEAGVETP
jgi:hypothetical protein